MIAIYGTSLIELARKEFVSTQKSVGVNEVPFFGNIITDKGLKADPSKIEAILKLEVPDSRKKLERFLGMVNYLSKFAPNHNEITSSLRSLLKKETEFLWDEPQSRAFERVKQTITQSPVLGQRHINITRNAIGPKSGQKDCRKF